MKLKDDKNWKAVRLDDRTLLPKDCVLYSESDWNRLLNLEVEPIEKKGKGYYRVIYK